MHLATVRFRDDANKRRKKTDKNKNKMIIKGKLEMKNESDYETSMAFKF